MFNDVAQADIRHP